MRYNCIVGYKQALPNVGTLLSVNVMSHKFFYQSTRVRIYQDYASAYHKCLFGIRFVLSCGMNE